MIAFAPLTEVENTLLTGLGFGLLLIFCFYLVSLWQLVRYVKYAEKLKFPSLILIVIGILALLSIFSDVALLSDIHKQYRNGLSQPELYLLYPILIAQFSVSLILTFLHVLGVLNRKQIDTIARDVNIFLIVQVVGLICGVMGLASASLVFLVPTAWKLTTHTTMGGIVLLFPYILALGYWMITKLGEEDSQLFDEKQRLDVGRAALLTLIVDTIFMFTLFVCNYHSLNGVIRLLWLPLYIFASIFLFSLGNPYYSSKA